MCVRHQSRPLRDGTEERKRPHPGPLPVSGVWFHVWLKGSSVCGADQVGHMPPPPMRGSLLQPGWCARRSSISQDLTPMKMRRCLEQSAQWATTSGPEQSPCSLCTCRCGCTWESVVSWRKHVGKAKGRSELLWHWRCSQGSSPQRPRRPFVRCSRPWKPTVTYDRGWKPCPIYCIFVFIKYKSVTLEMRNIRLVCLPFK